MDIKSAVYQIPSNDFLCHFAAVRSEALPVLGDLCLFVPPQGQQKLLYYKGYRIGLYIDVNTANLISDQMLQRTLIRPIF